MRKSALYIALLLTYFAIQFGTKTYYSEHIPHRLVLVLIYVWVVIAAWAFYFFIINQKGQ
ncbi:hypothetical protein EV203_12835 [Caldanaerobacter subterraneus]|jgi:hypothetical protein|uniref:Uncharacterized protein n=1 Tax=Caldanaerobacter subterraneus TaxID=911092 RepID=A0A4R2JL55_9THEO|nr:hypothetical protein [Thermoanaerobacter sp.]TCO57806.1 hypothetical protein EV203_12835 [Caldanaerobacter subterraneus]